MRGIMVGLINVVILDDHQGMVDGLYYRLSQAPTIRVVGTANYAGELEPLLAGSRVDVLLLDVKVPLSADDKALFNTPYAIPGLLERYPALSILVITMHDESALIRQIMDAGASGYVLKDDGPAIRQIASIVESIAAGGVYLSEKADRQLNRHRGNNAGLTERQLEIITYASAHPDDTSTDIAANLGIAASTVRNQLSRAYLTLGVRNLTAAIIKARELGLITPFQSRESPRNGAE